MMTQKILPSALLGLVLGMASCAAPKATVVAAAPVVKKQETKVPESEVPELKLPALAHDGIRGSDAMLALPGDGDFRATNPAITKPPGGSGGVVSRPPTDPPSRVKPKSPEPE